MNDNSSNCLLKDNGDGRDSKSVEKMSPLEFVNSVQRDLSQKNEFSLARLLWEGARSIGSTCAIRTAANVFLGWGRGAFKSSTNEETLREMANFGTLRLTSDVLAELPVVPRVDVTSRHIIRLLFYWGFLAALAYEPDIIERVLNGGAVAAGQDRVKVYRFQHLADVGGGGISRPLVMVFADHLSRSIVVAVRGTTSLGDIATDLLGVPTQVTTTDVPLMINAQATTTTTPMAHSGFLEAARNIMRYPCFLERLRQLVKQHPRYGVKVVGHSYGAGTASILHMMLYQRLYCSGGVCEGPPPQALLFETPPTWNETAVEIVNRTGAQVSVTNGFDLVTKADVTRIKQMLCGDRNPTDPSRLFMPGRIHWLEHDAKTHATTGRVLLVHRRDPTLEYVVALDDRVVWNHLMGDVLAHLFALHRVSIEASSQRVTNVLAEGDDNVPQMLMPLPETFVKQHTCGDGEQQQQQQYSQKTSLWVARQYQLFVKTYGYIKNLTDQQNKYLMSL